MRRWAWLVGVLFAVGAQADTSLPRTQTAPGWSAVCAAAIRGELAQHPEIAKTRVTHDKEETSLTTAQGDRLDLRELPAWDEEGEWQRIPPHDGSCWRPDGCRGYVARRVMGAMVAELATDPRHGQSFRSLAERVVEPCAAAARAQLQPPGYWQWQSECAREVRAAVARTRAREPDLPGTLVLLDNGVSVRSSEVVEGEWFAAEVIAPDSPHGQTGAVEGWKRSIGELCKRRAHCEILRANGYVGFLMNPARSAFANEVRPVLRTCMRPRR
jgi:hypothetical protein